MTSEYLIRHANGRVAAFRQQAWADSLRPSRRAQLAVQLHRVADRLGTRPQGGSGSVRPSRRAF